MKVKHLFTTKISRRSAIALALLLSLLIAVPVLADYIGPDRTETIYVNRRRHCHYVAVYDPAGPGSYSCYLDLYYPPGSSCPSNVASYFNPTECGWTFSCTDPGITCSISSSSSIESCTAAASLSLSGNEPLSGYTIIALEGTHNGTTFACSGNSCAVNLVEGANAFTFWALSDWGDSSEMGNANRGVDTRPPSISASASGTPGSGSWYVSAMTIDASASDPSPGSGLASFQAAVDGGGWSTYSGTITLNDGSHTLGHDLGHRHDRDQRRDQ
ncbi:MAG: hypothetical protein P8Z41_17490 [Anaerolineales bacterium]